jgi:branched-subunit amino acid transport protein
MERFALILAVAVASYLTRITGFSLKRGTIPPAVDRTLAYVPVAAFAALIVPGLGDGNGLDLTRVAGAILAGIAILVTGRLWASLLAGMAAYWALNVVS